MSEVVGGTFLEDADPKLREAASHIREVLQKYKIGGSFQLASPSHGEFGIEVPDWCAIQFEDQPNGDRGLRIKSSSERDGTAHLESSVHLFLSMRDMVLEHAAFLMKVGEMIETTLRDAGVDVEHRTLQERKHDA